MIGRAPGGYLDNAKRNEYNRKLCRLTAARNRSSTWRKSSRPIADGTRATFDWQGQTYERMIPEYGSDGRHLNESGRQRVAENLIMFLSQILMIS